jgi:hypothetical protein
MPEEVELNKSGDKKILIWSGREWRYIALSDLLALPHDSQLVIKIVEELSDERTD